MVLVGFAWFLGPLYAADSPLVFTLGIVASGLWGPVFGHLLLSFPTGRLPTRARRRVVAASYVLVPLAPVPALLVSNADRRHLRLPGRLSAQRAAHRPGREPRGCRSRVGRGDLAGSLRRGGRHAGPPMARGAAPERRSLVPLFASGGVSLALVAAFAVSQVDALLWLAFAAFAATPFAFLAGLARADLTGSRGVRTLMAELADAPERADLRDALARALGDPALELAFWMPELNCYVDAAGINGRPARRRTTSAAP